MNKKVHVSFISGVREKMGPIFTLIYSAVGVSLLLVIGGLLHFFVLTRTTPEAGSAAVANFSILLGIFRDVCSIGFFISVCYLIVGIILSLVRRREKSVLSATSIAVRGFWGIVLIVIIYFLITLLISYFGFDLGRHHLPQLTD
jgi:hypothetical protein